MRCEWLVKIECCKDNTHTTYGRSNFSVSSHTKKPTKQRQSANVYIDNAIHLDSAKADGIFRDCVAIAQTQTKAVRTTKATGYQVAEFHGHWLISTKCSVPYSSKTASGEMTRTCGEEQGGEVIAQMN